MNHIFVSYSKKQQIYARKLAEYLRQNGFDVWIDDRIDAGEDWWDVIVEAIQQCAAFTVVMTPESEGSRWVKREVGLADEWNKPIFPVLLNGKNWPIFVRTQYINALDGKLPSQDFIEDLAKVVPRKKTLGKDVFAHSPIKSVEVANKFSQLLQSAYLPSKSQNVAEKGTGYREEKTKGYKETLRYRINKRITLIFAMVSTFVLIVVSGIVISSLINRSVLPPTNTPINPATFTAATRVQRATNTANAIASFTKIPTPTFTASPTVTETPNVAQTVAVMVSMTDAVETANAIAPYTATFIVSSTFPASGIPETSDNQPKLHIIGDRVNVRAGPGTNFPVIMEMKKGDTATIIGISAEMSWWYILKGSARGWVVNSSVFNQPIGDISSIPIVQSPPTPTQTAVQATAVPPTSTTGPVADLVFSNVTLNPTTPTANRTFNVAVEIHNQGTVNAGNSLLVGVFQPGNETIPVAVPSIKAGQTITVNMPVTLKSAGANQSAALTLDKNNDINEGPNGEANNTKTINYNVNP